MVYHYSIEDEHLTATTPERYRNRWREQRTDHTNNIPLKKQESFPKSGNEGLYGFTCRHDGKIHIREDLIGDQRLETIIHESIHTVDEYETRRITEWIVNRPERNKYLRMHYYHQ